MTRSLDLTRATVIHHAPRVLVADVKEAAQVAKVADAVALVNKLVGPLRRRMADGSPLPEGFPEFMPYCSPGTDARGNRACVELFRGWVYGENDKPIQPKNLDATEAARLRAYVDQCEDMPADWAEVEAQALEPLQKDRDAEPDSVRFDDEEPESHVRFTDGTGNKMKLIA